MPLFGFKQDRQLINWQMMLEKSERLTEPGGCWCQDAVTTELVGHLSNALTGGMWSPQCICIKTQPV